MENHRLKVVIVDDSDLVRNLLEDLISGLEDVRVVGKAANATAAVEVVRTTKPDLVTLDLRMPDEDGYEVLRKLKSLVTPPKVAVLTNYPFSGARRRCAELGADYFFDKSTEVSKLVEVLRDGAARRA